jgi:hypothetical protein
MIIGPVELCKPLNLKGIIREVHGQEDSAALLSQRGCLDRVCNILKGNKRAHNPRGKLAL